PEQSAESHGLRLLGGPCDGQYGEDANGTVLRQADQPLLLELVLQRGAPGPDRGAALSAGFRRGGGECPLGRPDRLYRGLPVEPTGGERGPPHTGEARIARQARDGEVRCRRRPRGRVDRRSAQVLV